jgi:hypothetical protein
MDRDPLLTIWNMHTVDCGEAPTIRNASTEAATRYHGYFENRFGEHEAMAALEEGLTGRFEDRESALRPSSPTVKKRQRSIN